MGQRNLPQGQRCKVLLLSKMYSTLPAPTLQGRTRNCISQAMVQKNYLTMLLPISKPSRYPDLLVFLPINFTVTHWWLWKLHPLVAKEEVGQLSQHKLQSRQEQRKRSLPVDMFVGLNFGAGAEVHGKENYWQQKMEGNDRFRDITSSLKGSCEPFRPSVTQPQGD